MKVYWGTLNNKDRLVATRPPLLNLKITWVFYLAGLAFIAPCPSEFASWILPLALSDEGRGRRLADHGRRAQSGAELTIAKLRRSRPSLLPLSRRRGRRGLRSNALARRQYAMRRSRWVRRGLGKDGKSRVRSCGRLWARCARNQDRWRDAHYDSRRKTLSNAVPRLRHVDDHPDTVTRAR